MFLFFCLVSAGGIHTKHILESISPSVLFTLMESECQKWIGSYFQTNCLTLSTQENNFQAYSCVHGELLILLSFTHREWVLGCCAPTPRDKEMKFIGEGVYSRQCRVRISSCYSSKHNNFMLTKTSPLPLIKPLTRSGKAHACYLHDCFDQRHSSGLYPYEMFFSLRLKSSWHCQLNKYYGLSK